MSPSDSDEVPIAMLYGGSSYCLVEDSWVWGTAAMVFIPLPAMVALTI